MKLFVFLALIALSTQVYAEENEAASFVTVRLVKCWDDGAGNGDYDIVASNTHSTRSIRVTVAWISVARERDIDACLKPGQQKTIARSQRNAREIRIQAQFR